MIALEYLRSIKFPFQARQFTRAEGLCSACGVQATYQYFDVINDRLAKEWEINSELQMRYSERESMHCSHCRCSARLRALAKAVTLTLDEGSPSLADTIDRGKFKAMKVAEINACGDLHEILKKIPGLKYSEYAPKNKVIKHEDLQNLSYKSDSFDLVLTSDTLEHVPDYQSAIREVHRILKPGSYHIFTVPLIFSRKTRRRIKIEGNEILPVLNPSYHGAGEPDNLVSTELGIDFLGVLKSAGFQTSIYFGNPLDKNEVNYVFVSRKTET